MKYLSNKAIKQNVTETEACPLTCRTPWWKLSRWQKVQCHLRSWIKPDVITIREMKTWKDDLQVNLTIHEQQRWGGEKERAVNHPALSLTTPTLKLGSRPASKVGIQFYAMYSFLCYNKITKHLKKITYEMHICW